VTAETMRRYYTAMEKKRTAEEVLSGLQEVLRPVKKESAAPKAEKPENDTRG